MTHIRKRIRKLSTAVFRGLRSEYSFDVFPISPSITDAPAVFIFSRRFVDKKGRAHHAVSCVGEARSLVSEIKRHKRAKCVKGSEANVVCVLKEADPDIRVDLVRDISEARSFSCVGGKINPAFKPSPAKRAKTAKIIPIKAASAKAVSGSASEPDKAGPKRSRKGPAGELGKAKTKQRIKKRTLPELKLVRRNASRSPSPERQKPISQRSRAKVAHPTQTRLKRAA